MEESCVKRIRGTSHKAVLLVVLVLCCWLPLVDGYASGPPQTSCEDLRLGTIPGAFRVEGHSRLPQNLQYGGEACPYYIRLLNVNTTYQPNQDVMVAVVANQTTGQKRYTGLMMQALEVACWSPERHTIQVRGEPIGRFYMTGTSRETLLKPMTCNDVPDSTLAHFTPQWKVNETATWRVPSDVTAARIVFRATIVQDTQTYWTQQHSRILRSAGDDEPIPPCRAAHTGAPTSGVLVLTIAAVYLYRLV